MTRHELDFYESPHWFVTDTLRHIEVSGVVGECCVGNGAIASQLQLYPQINKVWTNDINPLVSADYHTDATQTWNFPCADWVISNIWDKQSNSQRIIVRPASEIWGFHDNPAKVTGGSFQGAHFAKMHHNH